MALPSCIMRTEKSMDGLLPAEERMARDTIEAPNHLLE